jgi:L-alanine-DL-glutamate epimerase-like enolase superfamily enzyme
MKIIQTIHFHEIARPLRVTFSTAQGSKDTMYSVIVAVTLDDGSVGQGECTTSLSLKSESINTIREVLATIGPELCGTPIDEYGPYITKLRRRHPNCPMAISGVEVALFRSYLASTARTEHSYWGGRTRSVETDITIPMTDDVDLLRRWLRYCFRKGFSVFKLKVSGAVERDKEMLSLVYRELTENLKDFTLRLDGNQGFSVKTYAQFTEAIRKAGYAIELFEQPLPKDDVGGMKEVMLFSPFPVILDETVITEDDAQRVAGENLAHGINIKITKSGIAESREILRVAQENGLKLMIGCMTETMIGLSAAIYFATGCAAFDYIDLDAAFFLHHKNRFNDIEIKGPRFAVLT